MAAGASANGVRVVIAGDATATREALPRRTHKSGDGPLLEECQERRLGPLLELPRLCRGLEAASAVSLAAAGV